MTAPCRALALAAVAGLLLACHEVHFESKTTPGEIDLYDDLFAVSVPTPERAIAVGYRGAVYETDDEGKTWVKRPSQTEASLYDVSMADPDRGWIVGQLGLVLRTEDGGVTWTKQHTSKADEGVHLFSVHAIDANTAWAVGEWGTRIYTDDGGESWQDLSLTISTTHPQYVWLSPPEQEKVRRGERVFEDVSLNDVYCRPLPSTRCWIVGEFGYIFHSEDGGRNWQRSKIVGTASVDPVIYPEEGTEVTEPDAERIKAFVKSILSQEHLNVLIEAYGSPREVQKFGHGKDPTEFFDILDARALGVRSVVEETGILSDRIRMRGTPPWDYEDYLEDDPGFLERYLKKQTADTPRVTVTIAQNPYLFRVRFADDMHGVITGLGGVVLTSDDGGVTWSYGSSGIKRAMFGVEPRLDGRTIAVGEKGLVRFSADLGQTWTDGQKGFPEIFTFMRDIRFAPSDSVGMIVGQRGLILRSEDRGDTWKKVLPPPNVAVVAE